MSRVVDAAAHARQAEPEQQVDEDQAADLAEQHLAAPVEHRVVRPRDREEHAEQPEHRARRADRWDVTTEQVAADRARRGREEVDREVQPRAVELLDERAREVQRVHVEDQVQESAVEQRHREQAPVLAVRDRELVEGE